MGQGSMDPHFGPGPWTTFMDWVHGPPVMDRVYGQFFFNNEKWTKTEIVQKQKVKKQQQQQQQQTMLDWSVMFNCAYKKGGGSVPHAKMLLVPMNCFLWWVDYASEENLLTEQMWIFVAYFILRGRDTYIDFLPLLKCKAVHWSSSKGF